MENIDILILFISLVIGFSITKEIFQISNNNNKEANRFFNHSSNSELLEEADKYPYRSNGISLSKKKGDEKYTLTPQSKLKGLDLS